MTLLERGEVAALRIVGQRKMGCRAFKEQASSPFFNILPVVARFSMHIIVLVRTHTRGLLNNGLGTKYNTKRYY